MEKNKNVLISVIILSFILVTFGLTSYTSASFGLNQEQRDAMGEAIEDGDYSKWKSMKEIRTRISDVVTEENFFQFSEIRNLIKEGKFREANVLRENLGLPERHEIEKFSHERFERGHGYMSEGSKLIEDGNYEEWKNVVGNTKISEVVQTEEDFQKLLEAHSLMKEGKYTEAKDVHRELGFTKDWIGERDGGMSEKWHGKIHLDK